MSDERTLVSDEGRAPQVALIPPGMAQFTTGEGQRKMLALAAEFKAMCEETERRGKPWLVQIGPGRHARIEAWQYLGQRAGITARVLETRDVRHPVTGDYEGVTAVAEAILLTTGAGITRAECDCYADEVQKKKKDNTLYRRWLDEEGKPNRQAIKGMAQTRACSRALAGALRFLAEIAGIEGTPAEEMDGVQPEGQPVKPPITPPQRKSANGGAAPQVVEGIVDDLQEKAGTTNGKPWRKWGVGLAGTYYGTFDTTVAAVARRALDFAEHVRLTWEQKGEHKTIVALDVVPSAAKPAAPREPGEDGDEFSNAAGQPKAGK